MSSFDTPFRIVMGPIRNAQLIYKEIPTGYPEPGKTFTYDTNRTIDLNTVPLNGGVLVKVLYLSVDPYMRDLMRDPSIASYAPAYTIGKPVSCYGIGKVIRSENQTFNAGDYVHAPSLEYAEYSIQEVTPYMEKFEPLPGLPLSVYVGALGMPGRTAYFAWNEYSKAKEGETLFISGAGGSVGTFVIQLAKLDGLKVIASAGTAEKVALAKSVGADIAFNYKNVDINEVLQTEGPVDVYWDNVGGPTLDAALGNANYHARFIECGMISGYNNSDGIHLRNIWEVVSRSISINGFLHINLAPKWRKEFDEVVPKKLLCGDIKWKEDLIEGLESSGEAILEVQTGKNYGKKVIHVAES
ncbi:hypothetical protein VKT23_008438 [Stygiomarasmius scandens]|uniref:Uncharacterized protein n=1 Tax=Marasmiellus scandens TaxID=2682957 RepID=A0ABR1JKN5_9AGAR